MGLVPPTPSIQEYQEYRVSRVPPTPGFQEYQEYRVSRVPPTPGFQEHKEYRVSRKVCNLKKSVIVKHYMSCAVTVVQIF